MRAVCVLSSVVHVNSANAILQCFFLSPLSPHIDVCVWCEFGRKSGERTHTFTFRTTAKNSFTTAAAATTINSKSIKCISTVMMDLPSHSEHTLVGLGLLRRHQLKTLILFTLFIPVTEWKEEDNEKHWNIRQIGRRKSVKRMKYALEHTPLLPTPRFLVSLENEKNVLKIAFRKTLSNLNGKFDQLWDIQQNLHMSICSITQPKMNVFVYFEREWHIAVAIKIQFDKTNEQFMHKLQYTHTHMRTMGIRSKVTK